MTQHSSMNSVTKYKIFKGVQCIHEPTLLTNNCVLADIHDTWADIVGQQNNIKIMTLFAHVWPL